MAFPLSHPAAVLPFTLLPKRWVSVTGLIIGSLVPDIEYLLRMRMESTHAGTWAGLFYFDLPAGLALCFIFHQLVRNDLIKNLPTTLRSRFQVFISFNWAGHFRKYWPAVLSSLLLGGATHILWDGFDLTHPNGHIYRSLQAWSSEFSSGTSQFFLIRAIQHLPSALGLAAIGIVIWKLPRHSRPTEACNCSYWLFTALMGTAFMVLRYVFFATNSIYVESALAMAAGSLTGMMVWGAVRRRNKE